MRVGGLAVGFRCAVERCVVLDECSVQQYGQVVVVVTFRDILYLYGNYSSHTRLQPFGGRAPMRVGGLAVGFRCAVERCMVLDECSVQKYGQVGIE